MSIPKIDPYPPAPTPEDDEATFDEKAYEHAASLETRRVQMNEVATYVNTRASDANNRAVAAAASATASANSAARADEWANKAPGSVVATGKYSARHYSDLSDKFANAPEDVEVEPGKFSALHWQEKAKKIANVHATTVATDPLPTVIATNVQEALRDLAYQSDQLRVAKNQLKYGDGPYPVLDFQFQGANMLDPRTEFTRASVDWDEYGNEYGIDVPVLIDKGLWTSGARTNLFLWSNDFQRTYWTKTQSTVEPSTVLAPDGTTTATKLIANTEESTHIITRFVSPPPDSVTFSVFAKAGELTKVQLHSYQEAGPSNPVIIYADLESGEVYQTGVATERFTITPFPGGWWRISGSGPVIEGNTSWSIRLLDDDGKGTFAGDGVSGLYIWRAQLEEGATPTPYIPTEASQVTVAESVLRAIETDRLRSVVIDLELLRNELSNNVLYILTWGRNRTGSIPSNGIMVWAQGATQIQVRVYNSGSSIFQNVPAKWDEMRRLGISIHPDRLLIAIDGTVRELETGKDVVSDALFANLKPALARQSKYRWLKSAAFYERALTASQLQELTTL